MKYPLIAVLLFPVLAGCRSTEYSTYTGNQAWLTTKDSVADKNYATPVYWNWPERPYRVMGSVQSTSSRKEWKKGDTVQSARIVKSKGGDALIVLDGGATGVNQDAFPAMRSFSTGSTSGLVIKWKSQSEIDEESHRLDGLRAYLKRSYPALELGSKNDLWEMSVEYVTWLGLDINSQPGAGKVEEVLSSLIASSPDASPSKRLFKGILRAKGTSIRPMETVVYGIATVTRMGDELAIDSQPDKMTFSFRGDTRESLLRGQLDFTSGTTALTGKAEGTMSAERIVLKSQVHTTNKPVQGTFILLR